MNISITNRHHWPIQLFSRGRNHIFSMIVVCFLVNTVLSVENQNSVPSGSRSSSDFDQLKQRSDDFLDSINELDIATSFDFLDTIKNSSVNLDSLNKNLPIQIPAHSRKDIIGPGFASTGNFVVRKIDVISTVAILAGLEKKLGGAEGWSVWASRDERTKRSYAKTESRRRTQQALQQYYRAHQMAIYQRQLAMQKLHALVSNNAKVVAIDNYSGLSRDASAAESDYYAGQLYEFSQSSFSIPAPRTTLANELYDFGQIVEIDASRRSNKRLLRFAQQQLKGLSKEHLVQVQRMIKSNNKDKLVVAIGSLGWWNGAHGLSLVKSFLIHPSDKVRQAAFSALPNMIHNCAVAERLSKHKDVAIRMIVAKELVYQMIDLKRGLKIVGKLVCDEDQSVRNQAYESFEKIADLRNVSSFYKASALITAFNNSSPVQPTIEAIDWIDQHWMPTSKRDIKNKNEMLSMFLSHRDSAVRNWTYSKLTN